MKRFATKASAFLLAVILCIGALPFGVLAESTGSYTYSIVNGEIIIDCYTASSRTVNIPAKLGKYPITGIGPYAFCENTNIRKVTLPEGLKEIGDRAFYNCSNLEQVVLPSSVETIGECAFEQCKSLKEVVIPESLEVLEDSTFSGCSSLKRATLPSGLEEIGHGAFAACSSLEAIDLPEGLLVLGDVAFWYCDKLEELVIPSTVLSIGDESLDGLYCKGLKVLEVASGNPIYHSAGNCIIETKTKTLLYGCSTSVIPTDGSVLKIADHAFAGSDFTTFTVPSPVTHVGMEAFIGCDRLKELILEDSVKTLGISALDMMPALETVRLSAGLTHLPEALFYGCTSLKKLEIPEGVRTIDTNILYGCDSLEELHLPSTVRTIADATFGYAGALRIITVAEDNPYFKSVGNCLIRIKDKCLVAGSAYAIIPDDGSVTKIAKGAFMGNQLLRGVIIPSAIQEIGREAFAWTPNLKALYIPDSVTTVGGMVFWESGVGEVYCQAASKPSGWSSDWNSESHAVARWGKAMCKHTDTTDDGIKSTCVEEGFLYRYCNKCYGTLVYSAQPLAEHIYGENGFCNICGQEGPHKPEDDPKPDVGCLYGDVSGDDRINTMDYVLLKRYVMKTYSLTEEQMVPADVNRDGRINTMDYVLLKRHVLGRYQINQE